MAKAKRSKKSSKKMQAVLAAVLAVVMLVAGTFAWIQSKGSVLNELSTSQITDGSVSVQEVFTPPASWDPGMTVDKQVSVINTGAGTTLVRVSFEELMTLLQKGGQVTLTNTYNDSSVISGNANALLNWIPVSTDISAYSAANGWTALTAAQIDTSKLASGHGLVTAANVTVMMKKEGGSFGYFAYRTVGADSYQKVDLGNINTIVNVSTGAFEKVEILGASAADQNIKFNWYEGKKYDDNSWAGTTEYATVNTTALKPTVTLFARPGQTLVNTLNSPLDKKFMDALTPAMVPMIKMNFGTYLDGATEKLAVTTTLATAVAEKIWYYNSADGYFYYMGKLTPGTATKLLLNSLTMADEASIEHSLQDYKLAVVYEAIQNTEAALRSDTGWNLSETTFPATGDFWLALKALCDN